MSAIEASSGTYRSRVDGTLVLTFEIEPRNAAAALQLFGMPGTPSALAALKPASSKPAEPEKEERPTSGPLCRWVAIRCSEPAFIAWIESAHPGLWDRVWRGNTDAEEAAAEVVRDLCGVVSRRDLDTDAEAAGRLHERVRKPYAAWLKRSRP